VEKAKEKLNSEREAARKEAEEQATVSPETKKRVTKAKKDVKEAET